MNRNTESHFSSVPTLQTRRSVFDRSYTHTTTFNFADCIPIMCEEVLPGDTVSLTTSKIIRMQTLLSPVMGNAYLDTYFFFCPNRILWDHWVNFMGENADSAWIPKVDYRMPRVGSPGENIGFKSGTVADYLGYPVGVAWSPDSDHAPSVLPMRGYAMIMDHFFRDQNLTAPLPISTGDGDVRGSNVRDINSYAKGGLPFRAYKYHDYFTSCLSSPQKGPDVNIAANMRLKLPVMADAYHGINTVVSGGVTYDVPGTYAFTDTVASGSYLNYMHSATGFTSAGLTGDSVPHASSGSIYVPNNLWAYGNSQNVTDATSDVNLTVNSLRIAVLTQMYYEALARAGSRYEEQLHTFFHVTNPDSRMQHPEYLGGNRIRLNVHEVTNTAQSEQDFLGDIGAKSATTDSHADFVRSFTEHGWLIGIAVARYDHLYSQGLPAKFSRVSKFDFYNPLFAQIGEQPVYDSEIYATTSSIEDHSVFGYQEGWASYRYAPNVVSGLMRPTVSGAFSTWTFADAYNSKPTLSAGWAREDPNIPNRVLAVTSDLSDQIFADFYFEAKWSRVMPMFSVPGAIGAF